MTSLDFLINSADRAYGTESDYYVDLPPGVVLDDYESVSLIATSMKSSVYELTGSQCILSCIMRDYQTSNNSHAEYYFQVAVAAGTYTPDELCEVLDVEIPLALGAQHPSYPALSVTCTHDDKTSHFNIAVNSAWARGGASGSYHLVFTVADSISDEVGAYYPHTYATSLNAIMGFEHLKYPPDVGFAPDYVDMTSLVYTSTILDRLTRVNTLTLCSDLVAGQLITSSNAYVTGQALAVVPQASFGRIGHYEPVFPRKLILRGDKVTRVHIWWLNSALERPELNGAEHNILLRFE